MPFPIALKDLFPETRLTLPGQLDELGKISGAYILALHLPDATPLTLKGEKTVLAAGWYAYAGSANGPGGIAARLARHFRGDKKIHWHIDRLSVAANECFALALENGHECLFAERLHHSPDFILPLPGFGSSDCRKCQSHLFRYQNLPG